MTKLNFAAAATALSLLLAGGTTANAAAVVPCEDLLKQLRDAEKAASMSDLDKARVAEFEDKGVERCNADDDKRADKFLGEALKIVLKK